MHQFPAKVEGVLHRHVHALARFGRMGVACIAGHKHMWVAAFIVTHIVKLVGQAVPNVINRPPHHFFHIH